MDTALDEATLGIEGVVSLNENQSCQLTLTGNKGYVAIWSSSDERIVTVDKNGRVTAVREGTAIITAKIGNKSVQCVIKVKSSWTENF